jgi:hypothetical protein
LWGIELRRRTIFLASLASLLIISYLIYFTNSSKIAFIHGDYALDVTQKNEVVGNSENVFLAKVIRKTGTASSYKGEEPYTQFEVEVIRNIKGKLVGTETVNQAMGYDYGLGGKTLVKYEDQEYLQPGKTYLFSTIHSSRFDWHTPIPVYGELEVNEVNEDRMIAEYTMALQEQIISDIMQRDKNKDFIIGYMEEQ